MAPDFEAKGDRNIVVGKDVICSIINTGNHNQFFIGDYERLRDAYIEPWSVFERVDLQHFVGREWLLNEIDTFLHDHDRGYFILEAGAGLGKTTFLAWLVHERKYIHHFAELAPGIEGMRQALKNLAAQVVLAYHLNAYEVEGVLPGIATRPDYLLNLLKQAASQNGDGEKIVLVIDALDEAATPPGQNVLGLPQVLPKGVFIIASQRPVPVTLSVDTATTPRYLFRLTANEPENLADMGSFLEKAVIWPGISRVLKEDGYTPKQLINNLLEKCDGVWMYLHFLILEIERGERSPLKIDELPDGMAQYYVRYWSRWHDEDEQQWYRIYLPILTTLAAVQEAVSIPQLCILSGMEVTKNLTLKLEGLFQGKWMPFLAVERTESYCRYRLYHASLREFLDGRIDRSVLTQSEQGFAEELARETQQAHQRIADRYLTTWGGWEKQLPELRDPGRRDLDGKYGLRYLIFHLEQGNRVNDLHDLLRMTWCNRNEKTYRRFGWHGLLDIFSPAKYVCVEVQRENTWYVIHEMRGDLSSYVSDVITAQQLAQRTSEWHIQQGTPAASMGLEVRYSLILASLKSYSKNISATFLLALVERGIWMSLQALAYAHWMDEEERMLALVLLLPYLPESKREEVEQEALAIVRAFLIKNIACKDYEKSSTLQALIWLLSYPLEPKREEIEHKALAIAISYDNPYYRCIALTDLIPHLKVHTQEVVLDNAFGATLNILQVEDLLPKMLERVAPFLPEKLLRRILETIQAIEAGFYPSHAKAILAASLAKFSVQEAMTIAQGIKVDRWRAEALASLADYLPPNERENKCQEALSIVKTIRDHELQSSALIGIAPHLPKDLLSEAWKIAKGIQNFLFGESDWDSEGVRALTLAKLASYFPPTSREQEQALQEALNAVILLHDRVQPTNQERCKAEALCTLAPHLSDFRNPGLSILVNGRALRAAREIKCERLRTQTLAIMLSHHPDPDIRNKILTEILESESISAPSVFEELILGKESTRTTVLSYLAQHIPKEMIPRLLGTVQTIDDLQDCLEIQVLLIHQLAKLGYPKEALALTRAIVSDPDLREMSARVGSDLWKRRSSLSGVEIWLEGSNYRKFKRIQSYFREELKTIFTCLKEEVAQAEALVNLAPYLPKELLPDALTIAREIRMSEVKSRAMAALSSKNRNNQSALTNSPNTSDNSSTIELYRIWHQTIVDLSADSRSNFLAKFRDLIQDTITLGGSEALIETFHSIQDVRLWWL